MTISVCPQCRSTVQQVGKFFVCGEHGPVEPVWVEGVAAEPLRIFLSYGHDSNEELVRRIKTDLEQRGHDVWFDKSQIKEQGIMPGDDWRRAITDGILKSHRVLSFLSKHSTRDPGVCRDEIAIAIGVKGGNIQTILVESEQEVQPPVNIGHIQWLDMHDWKERRDRSRSLGLRPESLAAAEAEWGQWYQAKLAEIVRVVESDESRRFAGEIETLNGHLKPIKSEARICQLLSKGFYGRQWLFEAVENWRRASTPSPLEGERAGVRGESHSRLFWIMGAPGVGKSAFAAQLTHTRGDTVIAAQFCEWDKPDHRDARRVVRSLAFQLATRLPDYRKLLLTLPEIAELDRKDAAELFDYLLANPLRSVINGGRQRYLIVIDALDEAGEAGRNPLVEMLARNAQRLPDWLGLVVTSRPEFDVKTPLQALNPFPLDTASESNRADIRDYLLRELASPLQNRPDADRLVEQILEKSEGVFLYAERFCDDVQQGHLSLDHPDHFPQGLGGIFAQYFQRQFPDDEKYEKVIELALGAILAAREPLPIEILQKLFGWRDAELRKWLRTLGSLFPTTADNGTEAIKPYHKSLADWLVNKATAGAHFVSVKEGLKLLGDFCLSHWVSGEVFAVSEAVNYLASLNRSDDLVRLLLDKQFQAIRQLDALCQDFEVAEQFSCGRLGIAGPVLRLMAQSTNTSGITAAELKRLFDDACLAAKRWNEIGIGHKVCAEFSAQSLSRTWFSTPEGTDWGISAVDESVQCLHRYSAGMNDLGSLLLEHRRITPEITLARSRPPEPARYDYDGDVLAAAAAGLSLAPTSMVRHLITASGLKLNQDIMDRYDTLGRPPNMTRYAWGQVAFQLSKIIRELVNADSKMVHTLLGAGADN